MSQRIKFKDVRHIVHVVIIILVVVAAFLIARFLTVPRSFGQYGHYRGDSVEDQMNLPVVLQSPETCRECHDRETESTIWPGYRAWQDGKHSPLTCENCHDRCKEHVELWRSCPQLLDLWKGRPDAFKVRRHQLDLKDPIFKNTSSAACLVCHRALTATPDLLKFYDFEKHASFYKALRREESKTNCIFCHRIPHK